MVRVDLKNKESTQLNSTLKGRRDRHPIYGVVMNSIIKGWVAMRCDTYSFMRLARRMSVRKMVGRVTPSQCKRARHSRAWKRSGSEKGLVEGSAGRGCKESSLKSITASPSASERTTTQPLRW